MPREEFLRFIQIGQTSPIAEFKSKKGRPFAAVLHLKDNGNFEFKFQSRKRQEAQEGASEGEGTDGGTAGATGRKRAAGAKGGAARTRAKVVKKTTAD